MQRCTSIGDGRARAGQGRTGSEIGVGVGGRVLMVGYDVIECWASTGLSDLESLALGSAIALRMSPGTLSVMIDGAGWSGSVRVPAVATERSPPGEDRIQRVDLCPGACVD